MERAAGIEPACITWKDSALPLSYARNVDPNKTPSLAVGQVFFGLFGNYFSLLQRLGDWPLAMQIQGSGDAHFNYFRIYFEFLATP